MKNIATIFVWDKAAGTVINKPHRSVDWVFQGKGSATRKWDGVAIKVENGKVFRRHEWHEGEVIPRGFVKLQDVDPRKPHAAIPGWVPVPDSFATHPQGTDEKALQEAWGWLLADTAQIALMNKRDTKVVNPYAPEAKEFAPVVPDGTYELCGPKIHGNHEDLKKHMLFLHGADIIKKVPRNYEGLKKFLETYVGEGIVWHYKVDGGVLMAKIKRRDFGFHTRVSEEDIKMAYKEEPCSSQIQVEEQLQSS